AGRLGGLLLYAFGAELVAGEPLAVDAPLQDPTFHDRERVSAPGTFLEFRTLRHGFSPSGWPDVPAHFPEQHGVGRPRPRCWPSQNRGFSRRGGGRPQSAFL